MSTTVTYKGNTLTTVDNATKTLKTAGKYMEGDVVLTDTDNTLVVTLSYNEQTEMWEPDKTFAEIQAAYQAEKTITVRTEDSAVLADGYYEDGVFYYSLFNELNSPLERQNYVYESQGLSISDEYHIPSLQSKSVSYTPSETAQSATVSADSGYDGLSSVAVDVGAISSTYVGSGITRRSDTDLWTSGRSVIVPAGYYSAQAQSSIAFGTEGTPTATKGTVSNHTISVTPSVINSAGYIAGGTKTGTAVSVSASELVSDTYTVSASGTHDVTNYASASVAAGGATASATKGTVSNHSVTVTPSVTRTAGYITAGTSNGTAVTVSASELVSGSETKTANGTYDVTNLAQLVVNIDDDAAYRRIEVCPQQTLTPDSDRKALPTGMSELVVGEHYVATVDGTEYVTTCCLLWETNHVIGEPDCIFSPSGDLTYPFVAVTATGEKEIYFSDTTQHTIKIERLEFTGDATILSSKSITVNGTYNASSDSADGYASVTVNVPSSVPSLQAKTNISPTTSSQTIIADNGYDGLSSVQINAMPNGTAGTPTATKGTISNHAISVTPSVTNTTGYITGSTKTGTAVSVSASELVSGTLSITSSGTKDVTNYASASVAAGSATAPSSINGTAATISTGTNTLTLTKTVSVTPSVTAGYISAGTEGNSSVSLTASVSTKAAATITPSTSNQTIAAGTYLTGAQTIAGDADLIASNIISTANIFGVQGSVVVQNYYTGTSEPSSSLGINGDLYFQTKE